MITMAALTVKFFTTFVNFDRTMPGIINLLSTTEVINDYCYTIIPSVEID